MATCHADTVRALKSGPQPALKKPLGACRADGRRCSAMRGCAYQHLLLRINCSIFTNSVG